MKIKIICCNNYKNFEEQVNTFLKNKIIHDIKYSSLILYNDFDNNGIPNSVNALDRVLIMYDEKED